MEKAAPAVASKASSLAPQAHEGKDLAARPDCGEDNAHASVGSVTGSPRDTTRRLTARDGSFAGVVAALIDPMQLARQIGAVDLGPQGSTALVGFDSLVRTRVVDGKVSERDLGRRLPPGAGILKHAPLSTSGHYWNTRV